ncbi:cyclic nucleotide-binding domain-containing protein [Chitinophaga sp. SYP-B3965]|uniref:Crp/Fnr family transcriptional regulator n=1 Tax=Chitinophaga sp. SYP-B3965 TaxID=2663120 RepID=UPI001299861D|nr:Crp/Fnr family transcriptional regulator [Chitinophaga sp. SYP-B3965]MRG45701.1 cyclic nucleotide-binding domain-containing protein [Chitinophaga sp. SYP-B3965]
MNKSNRGQELPFEFPFTNPFMQTQFCNLFNMLRIYNPNFTREVMDVIIPFCKVFSFKKGNILLDYGEVCNYVYFAVSGLVTAIENPDGRERHCWFMVMGDVIISIDSFYTQSKSEEKLVALEDTICIALHVDDLEKLGLEYPSFLLVRSRLTEYYYREAYARSKWIGKKPAERYALLLEHYPRFFNRVSDKALASYLGVSPRTFTRIKTAHFSK